MTLGLLSILGVVDHTVVGERHHHGRVVMQPCCLIVVCQCLVNDVIVMLLRDLVVSLLCCHSLCTPVDLSRQHNVTRIIVYN